MRTSASAESFPLGTASMSCGDKVFAWILGSVEFETFMSTYWEKKPLAIKRNSPEYYSGIFSRKSVENIIRVYPDFAKESILFSRSVDESSACPEDVEKFSSMVDAGWVAQVVQPQQKNPKLHALIERLENYTGTLWGSNFYLGSSAGSVPTCTNVELFVLQFAGSVSWKVYPAHTVLCRDSGNEYLPEDLGPCIVDEVLRPGDLLYIPRGCIYTSRCVEETGAQYLTLSTYHCNAWTDVISAALTETVANLTESDVFFRAGLPINWTSFFGTAVCETETNAKNRANFLAQFELLVNKIARESLLRLDAIADEMGADYIALRTPPIKRKQREEIFVFGPDPRTTQDLHVRLRNPSWVRIVAEEDGAAILFSCIDNDVSNHQKSDNPMDAEPTSVELDGNSFSEMKNLLAKWPEWTYVAGSREVLASLWEMGIIECRQNSPITKRQKIDTLQK